MPKIKTNSGSKKRFVLTGTGKIKRKHACLLYTSYGDITKHPSYDHETMGLRERDYTRNSKGESVLIKETGLSLIHI